MGSRLIVNLGSTRIAWRDAGGSDVRVHDGRPGQVVTGALAGREPPPEVIVGSVAARPITEEFVASCRAIWDIAPRELVASGEACGVHNAYAQPARLGIDRWAAMIAAYDAHGGAVLLADCGTAVTVDYVAAGGRHVGGLIAPGLGLMREALASGTRLAPTSKFAPTPPLFGTDTELGIAGGAVAAVAGLLAYAAEKTAARYGPPEAMLITGGDAGIVAKRLGAGWVQVPELVLDGLALLADHR